MAVTAEAERTEVSGAATKDSLAVIAVAAVAMFAADAAASYLIVLAMFGGLPFLLGTPVVAVILTLVISVLSRAMTGRWHVLGAVTATIALAGAGAYGLLNGILNPIFTQPEWWPHALVCLLTAGLLGLFLGPVAMRIVGAISAVTLIATLVLLPTSADKAAEQHARNQQQLVNEQLDYFLAEGTRPVVTDLAGWRNPLIRATGGDAMTWVVSDDGAVADIRVTGHVNEATMDPMAPCTWIQRPGDAGGSVNGALPDWCVQTEAGWVRGDGNGASFVRDGTLIAVNIGDDYDIRDTGGSSPATPEEISALAASLRPMTDAEIDKWVLPTYAGVDSPVVRTSGL
ncbi:hypothetical protein [Microbacterium aurantiacum]|uniref:Uncharacterized protein n=1 Tax=Microbacterium aurantiacum TaxID=162393 RepID=A0A0M8MI91_9MICO|nr:hypothetical protein [Microbacterium chocolatum]ANG86408.1 hypothetical protein A8L33_14535 [Microbacterium chocolatum]KOS10637.1 hypothetical protein XI38_09215 [Microbacterium chocolatum]